MNPCTAVILLSALLALTNQAGTFVTLSFNHRSASDPDVVTLIVASNQVAKLVSAKLYRTSSEQQLLRITRIGEGDAQIAAYNSNEISAGNTNGAFNGLLIRGPVRISYEAFGQFNGFATFEITNTEEITSASNSVVIPADASGPVQVVLESSQDLISWTEAQPGTYGASTQKRFFRVRAKNLPP
jgi:hypothetical protein